MCWRCASRPCYFNPRTPVGCDTVAPFSTICATISIHAPQWGATVNSRTGIAPPLFQSTHPSGVRRHPPPGRQIHLPISSHAPQWGATRARHQKPTIENDFNPRTPVGCDDMLFPAFFSCSLFQSTHPSGVRRICLTEITSIMEFQSTHPSGVRLPLHRRARQRVRISIHAPQWGATISITEISSILEFQSTHPSGVRLYRAMLRKTVDMISIHAPQWGATPPFVVLREPQGYFNPRTPVGCDQRPSRSWRFRRNFNPRTPVGCDSPSTSQSTSPTAFQSTHPSGVRHNAIFNICEYATRRSSASTRYFNPRTPVGCDRIGWSATYQGVVTFQSTHPSGVRRHDSVISSFHLYFNPRTPVGCDTTGIPSGALKSGFQSTHPSGVRPSGSCVRQG